MKVTFSRPFSQELCPPQWWQEPPHRSGRPPPLRRRPAVPGFLFQGSILSFGDLRPPPGDARMVHCSFNFILSCMVFWILWVWDGKVWGEGCCCPRTRFAPSTWPRFVVAFSCFFITTEDLSLFFRYYLYHLNSLFLVSCWFLVAQFCDSLLRHYYHSSCEHLYRVL